jgi:hypothetical protein
MKKWIAGAVLATSIVSVGGTAFAGENTGTGKPTNGPAHANSICAFSGLEDGSEPGTTAGPGNTQNWGQIPHEGKVFLTSIGENPGQACNGHLSPMK